MGAARVTLIVSQRISRDLQATALMISTTSDAPNNMADRLSVAQRHQASLDQLHRLRQRIRQGEYDGHTSGLAPGFAQGNVVIVPESAADEFLRFCQRNPKPCPLLAVSEPGDPSLPELGVDIDIRTDVPRYRVFRSGRIVDTPNDIRKLWTNDWVTFVLGCSFTFEEALVEAGIALRHVSQGRNVAMYRTRIQTRAAGRFHGPLVVSMRPLRAAEAIRAVQVTSRFPSSHGAPVHLGAPELIGISRIDRPDWGDAVEIRDDELAVFWACGVTPQVAIQEAGLELCITHDPGCMLITDLRNTLAEGL